MEKKTPHYSLARIKATFSSPATLRLTNSARVGARAVGLDLAGIVRVVQSIERKHFYKSMPSYADTTIWQDVYHVPEGKWILYVKFTVETNGKLFLLISFKEK